MHRVPGRAAPRLSRAGPGANVFAPFMKYIAGGLGITTVLLGAACGVMWWKINANAETITALRSQLDSETAEVLRCGTTLAEVRREVDTKNAEVDELKTKATASVDVQAEADRLAREKAKAERRLAEIEAERTRFAERLAELPRCQKYLETLLAIAGGRP